MDYLGIQGYWVCVIVAVMTLVIGLLSLGSVRNPVQAAVTALILGMLSLFFYVGGIGVREGSRFAAAIVFVIFALDAGTYMLTSPISVGLMIKLAITVVLFSNLRATWIAARWVPGTEESALPPRRRETFGDRFVDQWPRWVWPKIRILYYVFSVFVAFVVLLGYAALLFKHPIR